MDIVVCRGGATLARYGWPRGPRLCCHYWYFLHINYMAVTGRIRQFPLPYRSLAGQLSSTFPSHGMNQIAAVIGCFLERPRACSRCLSDRPSNLYYSHHRMLINIKKYFYLLDQQNKAPHKDHLLRCPSVRLSFFLYVRLSRFAFAGATCIPRIPTYYCSVCASVNSLIIHVSPLVRSKYV